MVINRCVYEKLKEKAKSGKTITYQDLSDICGLGLNYDNAKDRNEIGKIVGEISKYEHKNGRPMLSAVVVLKGSKPITPGKGFYTLASELGFVTGRRDYSFYVRELKRVFQYWKGK